MVGTNSEAIRLAHIEQAAQAVVDAFYGANPRHTKARSGGCRDDCIPCRLKALHDAVGGYSWQKR